MEKAGHGLETLVFWLVVIPASIEYLILLESDAKLIAPVTTIGHIQQILWLGVAAGLIKHVQLLKMKTASAILNTWV